MQRRMKISIVCLHIKHMFYLSLSESSSEFSSVPQRSDECESVMPISTTVSICIPGGRKAWCCYICSSLGPRTFWKDVKILASMACWLVLLKKDARYRKLVALRKCSIWEMVTLDQKSSFAAACWSVRSNIDGCSCIVYKFHAFGTAFFDRRRFPVF